MQSDGLIDIVIKVHWCPAARYFDTSARVGIPQASSLIWDKFVTKIMAVVVIKTE
jgi:hypothetical protein